jgi:cytosine/adenosine deaminase-related metal-dependent hydrolase
MSGRRGEVILSGTVISGEEFKPINGYICISDGKIKEIDQGEVDSDHSGIICPRFFNAHTHIGDSVIKDPPFMPLSDLVGPGGLKHRVLESTPLARLIEGMRRTLMDMEATGTCAFADFREGGIGGVDLLLEALEGIPLISKILGRPYGGSAELHEACWGLGISSTRDIQRDALLEAASLARERGKVVAVHAGEAGQDDIEEALRLEPDFLVHLCRATESDLEKIAISGTSVAICPRSNLVTGVGLPNVKKMLDLGINLGVGTDNAMLNSADMFSEMEIISKALLHDDRQVFKMCTLNGARIMGIDNRAGSIDVGKEGRVMVIDDQSNNLWGSIDPLASIVRRARPSDIKAVF